MQRLSVRLAAVLCMASCAVLGAVEIWPVARSLQTTDQNGDGRPDVWRHFDVRGQVTEVDVDSNFDGKPDIEEYYERGVLVRRESDRNFNGQADLVEEFDAATHGQTRSVIDIDFDGKADLLLLFRDGSPVFSKRTSSKPLEGTAQQIARRDDGARLVPMMDPFQSETAIRTAPTASVDEECVGLSTSGGLPSARIALLRRLSPSARILAAAVPPGSLALLLPRSPRAPPVV
jgi:hypothetical protein